MKKIYKITYFCGYIGTDETDFIKADCLTKIEEYADDRLPEYASSWESLVSWTPEDCEKCEKCKECENYGENCFYESQEYANYIEGCGYTIEEATEEDFDNWRINPNEVLDIS